MRAGTCHGPGDTVAWSLALETSALLELAQSLGEEQISWDGSEIFWSHDQQQEDKPELSYWESLATKT